MYNPDPLYAQNSAKLQSSSPKYQYFKGCSASAPSPSPLFTWWVAENKKRDAKLLNEHCINEIKVARNNKVKNNWSMIVESFPEKIHDFLQKPTQQGYEELLRSR